MAFDSHTNVVLLNVLNIYFDEVLLGNNFLYGDYLHLIYLNEPVVIIIQSFLHSFITWFAIKVKRRVPLVGQELPAFCGFPVAQYSLSCVVFCKSLLIPLLFFTLTIVYSIVWPYWNYGFWLPRWHCQSFIDKKDATDTQTCAYYLDLNLVIDNGGRLRTNYVKVMTSLFQLSTSHSSVTIF